MSDNNVLKVFLTEKIIEALLAKDPTIELEIAHKLKVATSDRVIKKLLNDETLLDSVRKLITANIDRLAVDAGIALKSDWYSQKVIFSPRFKQQYQEALGESVRSEVRAIARDEINKMFAAEPSLVETLLTDKLHYVVHSQLTSSNSALREMIVSAAGAILREKVGL